MGSKQETRSEINQRIRSRSVSHGHLEFELSGLSIELKPAFALDF